MIPDDVEKIIMTKEDYDRNVEQLLYDKIKAEQEIERLYSIIKEVREYVDNHYLLPIDKGLLEILDKENKE